MSKWYVRSPQGTKGPLELEELVRQLREGVLDLSAEAYEQGQSNWRPLREITALRHVLNAPPPSAPKDPLYDRASRAAESYVGVVHRLLDRLRPTFNNLNRVNSHCLRIGHLCGLLSIGVGLANGFLGAAAKQQATHLLLGLGFAVAGTGALSTLSLTARALDRLYSEQQLKVRSPEILDSLSTLLLTGASVASLVGLGAALGGNTEKALVGFAATVALGLVGLISLSRAALGITQTQETSQGEETITLLLFLPRCCLRLALLATSIGLAVVAFGLLSATWEIVAGSASLGLLRSALLMPVFLGVVLFPLLAYVSYLLMTFLLNIARAILILPSKLDK